MEHEMHPGHVALLGTGSWTSVLEYRTVYHSGRRAMKE